MTVMAIIHPLAQAGIPRMLRQSAVYPRDFGIAVANLMVTRGKRSGVDVDIHSYPKPVDDLGALDDLLKGSRRTWWRRL